MWIGQLKFITSAVAIFYWHLSPTKSISYSSFFLLSIRRSITLYEFSIVFYFCWTFFRLRSLLILHYTSFMNGISSLHSIPNCSWIICKVCRKWEKRVTSINNSCKIWKRLERMFVLPQSSAKYSKLKHKQRDWHTDWIVFLHESGSGWKVGTRAYQMRYQTHAKIRLKSLHETAIINWTALIVTLIT